MQDNWFNTVRDFIPVIPTSTTNNNVNRAFLDQWYEKTQIPWTPSEPTNLVQPQVVQVESTIVQQEWSPEDMQTIANFFPELGPELFEKAQKFQNFQHSEKQLLLDGPPQANEHSLDPDKVKQWIESHCTSVQRDIAKELASHFQQVSWSEFLMNVRKVAGQVADLLKKRSKPTHITLVVLSFQKSQGVMAAIFALALEDYGYTIDAVTNVSDSKMSRNTTYIWFDDIAFSGSQTIKTFQNQQEHERQILKPILKYIYGKQANDTTWPQNGKLPLFTTKAMLARILDAANIQIIVVRAMTAQQALEKLRTLDGFPVFVIPGTLLQDPSNVIPNLSQKLRDYDSNYWQPSSSFVQTDYKVPDMSSTFLLPISGRIPKCPDTATEDEKVEYARKTASLPTETIREDSQSQAAGRSQKVLDLIRNCSTESVADDIVENDALRCPQPQQKLNDFQQLIKSQSLAGGKKKSRKRKSKRSKNRSHSRRRLSRKFEKKK